MEEDYWYSCCSFIVSQLSPFIHRFLNLSQDSHCRPRRRLISPQRGVCAQNGAAAHPPTQLQALINGLSIRASYSRCCSRPPKRNSPQSSLRRASLSKDEYYRIIVLCRTRISDGWKAVKWTRRDSEGRQEVNDNLLVVVGNERTNHGQGRSSNRALIDLCHAMSGVCGCGRWCWEGRVQTMLLDK